jgi:hypothetical protein
MDKEWLAIVRQRFQADGWAAQAASAPPLFAWNLSIHRIEVAGFTCDRVRQIPTSNELRALGAKAAEPADELSIAMPAVSQGLWRTPARPGVLLKADLFECASREQALELLLRLLGEFESPLMTQKSEAPGDVAFGGPGDGLLLFRRGNVVCLCRNADRAITSVMPIASALDRAASGGGSPTARRRRFAAEPPTRHEDTLEGDVEVTLLESAMARRADEEIRRFAAPAGDILLKGDSIMFRGPAAAARQLEIEEGL